MSRTAKASTMATGKRARRPRNLEIEPDAELVENPAPSTLESSVGYALRRAQLYAFKEFSVFMQEFDVRPAQFALLIVLQQKRGLAQSRAGSILGIEKANMTGLLVELQARNLVERRASPDDRRAYTLYLTRRGIGLTRRLIKRHEQYEEALSLKLGAGGKELLLSLLHRLK